MLGLDPLFILGSRQRGGPFVVHHPLTQRVFGVTEIVWRRKGGGTSQFLFGGPPPNPAPGTMASAPGTGVAHRGG